MSFTAVEQKEAAVAFVEKWSNRGAEKQEAHNFWYELLLTVFGVSNPAAVIEYEKKVHLGNVSYIDVYIPGAKVLIEQKGSKVDLNKKEKQSDGEYLTPYEQAFRYAGVLPLAEKPKYIITCNFRTFQIYDQNHTDPLHQVPVVINLEDLPKSFSALNFLVDLKAQAKKAELDISFKAGTLIGKLYDSFIKQYGKSASSDPAFLQTLNKLCVRLVFCLYAEDAFLFPKKGQFGEFLKTFTTENLNVGLEKLFKILSTKESERYKYTHPKYLAFPYVDGGLFEDSDYQIPVFSQEAADILIKECSDSFDWSGISPTIFGAMFESTLNPETRRIGGMHYTSIENIHKVIDPLFLDELEAEYQVIEDKIFKERHLADVRATKVRVSLLNEDRVKLENLQKKIASLKFLDPACGSGNFLTETYLCLRRLENKILFILNRQQRDLFREINVQVSISNFYGIEINDFAVSVAKTALWIAEAQMLEETNNLLGSSLQFLPLKSFEHIVEANALRFDWNEMVSSSELNYIIGNPPFVGARLMTAHQKEDVALVFKGLKGIGNLDYVCSWYKKCANYIKDTDIECALVSTNSISQGLQASLLWKSLIADSIKINFAYRTFVWNSQATDKAHVFCVIVSFSYKDRKTKVIFSGNTSQTVSNINPYLMDATNCIIEDRKKPLCDVSPMVFGSMPNDGGYLILSEDEKNELIEKDSANEEFIRPFLGGEEYINNKKRYCLWLVDKDPSNSKAIVERIKKVRELRLASKRVETQKLAKTSALFGEIRQPTSGSYLLVPRTSSDRRKYIPIGFLGCDVIASDGNLIIPNATLYEFGIITSSTHMAWMRVVAGRLGMSYRYSASIVYNNFIWPDVDKKHRDKISKTAKKILSIRDKYLQEGKSYADLYGEKLELFYSDLLDAHLENDKAVLEAYGLSDELTEEEIVSHLMQLYADKVQQSE